MKVTTRERSEALKTAANGLQCGPDFAKIQTLHQEIARCRSEQMRCREHIERIGTDNAGAWLGASDWMHEELLIEEELENLRTSCDNADSVATSKAATTGGCP